MILKKAVIKNFRLLHDVTFNFDANTSDEGHYGFTVIRGENTFGKTTTLNALRWAFFGSEILDSDYRLVDRALAAKKSSTMVSVQVFFAIQEDYEDSNKRRKFGWVDYRVKRSVTESGDLDTFVANRSAEDSLVIEKKFKNKWVVVDGGQVVLQKILPSSIDELFFIDGDRALTFVDSPTAHRRTRVRQAATELLETELLQETIDRIDTRKAKVLREERAVESSEKEYSELQGKKRQIESDLAKLQTSLEEASAENKRWEEEFRVQEANWEAEIKKGDKTELTNKLEDIKRGRNQSQGVIDDIETDLSDLLVGDLLTRALVFPVLKKGATRLKKNTSGGQLSSAVISALETLLSSKKECFCGTSLAKGTDCRKHLQEVIADQKEAEDDTNNLDRLRDSVSRWIEKDPRENQREVIKSKLGRHSRSTEDYEAWGIREAELITQLENLADSEIDRITELKNQAKQEVINASNNVARLGSEIQRKQRELTEVESDLERLGKEVGKESHFMAKVEVHEDLLEIIKAVKEEVLTNQLEKLSESLNSNFKRMVGEVEGDGSVVDSVVLSEDFDIRIKNSAQGELNPAHELSGAQKRALAYSFIHALVRESGIAAPSVIDTPLGMTSGPVKREIVRQLIRNSRQLILFLTRDEIKNVDDLISEQNGSQITITRVGSGAVKNQSAGTSPTIRVCECGIKSTCATCELVPDFEEAIQGERGK